MECIYYKNTPHLVLYFEFIHLTVLIKFKDSIASRTLLLRYYLHLSLGRCRAEENFLVTLLTLSVLPVWAKESYSLILLCSLLAGLAVYIVLDTASEGQRRGGQCGRAQG